MEEGSRVNFVTFPAFLARRLPSTTSMPSLTASSSLGGRSAISRVNSFKRDWEDENTNSSGREVEWSPSPERVQRKIAPEAKPVKMAVAPLETAADRRRRAILEAMSQNTSEASTSAASSSRAPMLYSMSAFPDMGKPKPVPQPQATLPPAPVQTLPELPTLSRKRNHPWEEDFSSGRKVTEDGRASLPTLKKTKPSLPTISIQQKLVLSSEQQKVLTYVVQGGQNVFFTGSAGTGKSVLLREIIKALHRKYAKSPDAVAVTASTGIAACNIGGVTLHSFGGVGLAHENAEELVRKIRRNKKAASRWTRTKVLIIDEVSMVDGDLFDKYNKIGQLMRKKLGTPFGGIQVIVTGDFFQLPPVTKSGVQPTFAFEAQTWKETIQLSVNLSRVFRQKDSRFVEMLNEMRFGRLTSRSISEFQKLNRAIFYNDGIEPTELFPRREDVDKSNQTRLAALNTDGFSYGAVDGGAISDPVQKEKMLSNFMAPKHIFLKVDAQVMLIKNVDETLVNGSMGKVIGFCHKIEYIADNNGMWRPNAFEEDLDPEDDTRQMKLKLLRAKISPGSKPLPVVRFNVPGGGKRDMLVEFDQFKTELPNGEVQVSRTQLPLILAWAMSIHKAQGQTLDRVKVDLNKVFEKGQAYVALSRATSLEGLEVRGFRPEKVMAHAKVKTWSSSLQDLN